MLGGAEIQFHIGRSCYVTRHVFDHPVHTGTAAIVELPVPQHGYVVEHAYAAAGRRCHHGPSGGHSLFEQLRRIVIERPVQCRQFMELLCNCRSDQFPFDGFQMSGLVRQRLESQCPRDTSRSGKAERPENERHGLLHSLS